MKKIWASFLEVLSSPQVRNKLLDFLNTKGIKYLVVSVLKLSGIKAWLLTLLAEEVIEEADEHLIEPMFRRIGYYGDRLQGATIYAKVNDAQSVRDWLNTVRDV